MARIDLSEEEATALHEVLESALSELRYEIHNTDAQDYRTKLRTRLKVIEKVLSQIGEG